MPLTTQFQFWVMPVRPPWGFGLVFCQQMRDEILVAMSKALASGVVEYHVGSRGLKRFTLKELQDLLIFWTNQLQAEIMGSGIIVRRGIPTDY